MGVLQERIKQQRVLLKLTLLEVADQLGVKEATVQRYESGEIKNIKHETIEKLARILKVSPEYLMGWRDRKPYFSYENEPSSISNAVSVPVFDSVPALIPVEAIEDILDYEEIPREMTAGGCKYFGMRVKGDSMEPEYRDGDTVLIIRQDDCKSGQIAVTYVNDAGATLKRVVKAGDSVILQSLNPTYDPLVYRLDDKDNPVIILGVVVEIRRKV